MDKMAWVGAVVAPLVIPLLGLAAWTDIATRTLPGRIAAAIAVVGIIGQLLACSSAVLVSVVVTVGLFGHLVALHTYGLFGGGEVRPAAGVCLGFSPMASCQFVYLTAMAGGVLAVLHPVPRHAVRNLPFSPPPRGRSLLRRVFHAERRRIARHGSLSYGVVIACGGIWTVLYGSGN
jgi:Flp pilus assembly protein protease CpaA